MNKQSFTLLRPKGMPRYDEELTDDRFYCYQNAKNKLEPRENSRAVYADPSSLKVFEWARKNLGAGNFTIASRA